MLHPIRGLVHPSTTREGVLRLGPTGRGLISRSRARVNPGLEVACREGFPGCRTPSQAVVPHARFCAVHWAAKRSRSAGPAAWMLWFLKAKLRNGPEQSRDAQQREDRSRN